MKKVLIEIKNDGRNSYRACFSSLCLSLARLDTELVASVVNLGTFVSSAASWQIVIDGSQSFLAHGVDVQLAHRDSTSSWSLTLLLPRLHGAEDSHKQTQVEQLHDIQVKSDCTDGCAEIVIYRSEML